MNDKMHVGSSQAFCCILGSVWSVCFVFRVIVHVVLLKSLSKKTDCVKID